MLKITVFAVRTEIMFIPYCCLGIFTAENFLTKYEWNEKQVSHSNLISLRIPYLFITTVKQKLIICTNIRTFPNHSQISISLYANIYAQH